MRNAFISEMRRQQEARRGLPSNYKPPVRYDGGVDSAGVHYRPIWPKVAKFALQHAVDPLEFVRAQFVRDGRSPTPAVLVTDEALAHYQSRDEKAERELTLAFVGQMHGVQTEVGCRIGLGGDSELEAWISVLYDLQIELGSLFRYCMAVKLVGLHGKTRELCMLRAAFRPAAAIQYQSHAAFYSRVWHWLIPPAFPQWASRFVEAVIAEQA
jgi:hypothetical protein